MKLICQENHIEYKGIYYIRFFDEETKNVSWTYQNRMNILLTEDAKKLYPEIALKKEELIKELNKEYSNYLKYGNKVNE